MYATKEKRNAYMRKYQSQPHVKQYKKEYHANLSEEKKAEYRKVSDAWHERNRELDSERAISRKQFLRVKVLEKLGNKCSNPACQWLNADGSRGCIDSRCLQIDHVHGDGAKEQKGSETYYKKVLLDDSGSYQLLCANCNWIKRCVNKEYRKRA